MREGPPPPPPPDDRPHRPPRDGGRALSPPLQPSHTPVRPAPPDPVLSPRPTAGGGGPTRTRVPGHPSPHTTTEGGGKGLRREAGRQAGKGTRPRHGRGEKRAGEPDRRPQEAWWGWGTGSGRQPRGSEGVGNRGSPTLYIVGCLAVSWPFYTRHQQLPSPHCPICDNKIYLQTLPDIW